MTEAHAINHHEKHTSLRLYVLRLCEINRNKRWPINDYNVVREYVLCMRDDR